MLKAQIVLLFWTTVSLQLISPTDWTRTRMLSNWLFCSYVCNIWPHVNINQCQHHHHYQDKTYLYSRVVKANLESDCFCENLILVCFVCWAASTSAGCGATVIIGAGRVQRAWLWPLHSLFQRSHQDTVWWSHCPGYGVRFFWAFERMFKAFRPFPGTSSKCCDGLHLVVVDIGWRQKVKERRTHKRYISEEENNFSFNIYHCVLSENRMNILALIYHVHPVYLLSDW